MDASNFRKSENCGTKICKNTEQISCAQDSNSTLKPQEPSVLDGHQESELVKILEMWSFIRES
ncbi:MAG TPA: hypothetical protein VJH65_01520 [Candidatus Nanoarchaeia archaeon]|nr:hypothetical protein [Candidatus Nanoarchaeia archaeon]